MTSSGWLTGDEVRQLIFRKPPLGKRGYDRVQVDAFLQRVADTLDGTDSLTADQVRNVVFGKPARISDRGYDEEEVDATLDIVTGLLRQRAGGDAPQPAADAQSAADAQRTADAQHTEPLSGYQIRQATLRNSIAAPGYDKQQVDEFMNRAADALDGSGMPLTVDQLENVTFGKTVLRRGYRVDDVDALLNRITAELRRRSAGW